MALAGNDFRRSVADLNRLAARDLARLWAQVRTAAEAREALNDILPALIDTYGAAAATVAATWYDDLRDKVSPPKPFTAIPAPVGDRGAPALIGWALDQAQDFGTFQTLVEGGTQRRIADVSRDTVRTSSVADPSTAGWKRIGAGACPFCRMLIERDVLYTQATADFASHDHCNCQAYPIIKGAEPIDVKDYVQSAKTAQKVGESDAAYAKRRETERKRVREWIAENQ